MDDNMLNSRYVSKAQRNHTSPSLTIQSDTVADKLLLHVEDQGEADVHNQEEIVFKVEKIDWEEEENVLKEEFDSTSVKQEECEVRTPETFVKIEPSYEDLIPENNVDQPESSVSVKEFKAISLLINPETRRPFYKCNICGRSRSQRAHIWQHMRAHLKEKPFKCSLCNFKSKWNTSLKVHAELHKRKRVINCNECNKIIGIKLCNEHTLKPFKCNKCDYKTRSRSYITRHKLTHEKKTEKKIDYKCEFCSYTSSSKGNLKKHVRCHTENKSYQCDVCEYSTRSKITFVRHRKSHTWENFYSCDKCRFTASNAKNLKIHQHVHTKDLQCDLCDYNTSSKRTLTAHRRKHAENFKEHLFACKLCPYTFKYQSLLDKHIEVHSPAERRYRCDKCNYNSTDINLLVTHMKSHTK